MASDEPLAHAADLLAVMGGFGTEGGASSGGVDEGCHAEGGELVFLITFPSFGSEVGVACGQAITELIHQRVLNVGSGQLMGEGFASFGALLEEKEFGDVGCWFLAACGER